MNEFKRAKNSVDISLNLTDFMENIRQEIFNFLKTDKGKTQVDYVEALYEEDQFPEDFEEIQGYFLDYLTHLEVGKDQDGLREIIEQQYPELLEAPFFEDLLKHTQKALSYALLEQIPDQYVPLFERAINITEDQGFLS